MEIPKYLVQVDEKTQYAYWDKEILKIDMKHNKEEGKVKIFKKVPNSLVLKYRQISEEEL